MSPPTRDDADDEGDDFDEPTPTPIQVQMPSAGASPIDWARYECAVARNDVARETIRRNKMGNRLGRRLDRFDGKLIELRDFQLRTEGEDGTNGRFSVVRGEVAGVRVELGGVRRLLVAVAIAAVSGLGAAGASVLGAVEARGAERTRLDQAERAVQSLTVQVEQLRSQLWLVRFPPSQGTLP